MNGSPKPYVALVDDDIHSARLLTRMLTAHGSPEVRWHDSATTGAAEIAQALAEDSATLPDLIVVDLKASSDATRDFIAGLRKLEGAEKLLVVAMSATLDKDIRDVIIDSGADAVFQRHPDIDPYRREVANIVCFWVRNQRLNAIGA